MMLDQDKKLKLIDFGLGYQMSYMLHNEYCGTPLFVAPEVVKEIEYTAKLDVWSVGIIQYMLFSGGIHPIWKPKMKKPDYY
jgi:serine/threonine protein kinase